MSGGEEGARYGPSLMPGGSFETNKYIKDILLEVAAQVLDSGLLYILAKEDPATLSRWYTMGLDMVTCS